MRIVNLVIDKLIELSSDGYDSRYDIFGTKTKEAEKLRQKPEKRLPKNSYRYYSDCVALQEEPFENVSMNRVFAAPYSYLIAGEGPYQRGQRALSVSDLNTIQPGSFGCITSNIEKLPPLPSRTISFLGLGNDYEIDKNNKRIPKYDRYAEWRQQNSPNIFSNKPIDIKNPDFSVSDGSILCLQIPGWGDMRTFDFRDEEVNFLFRWLDDSTGYKFVHCSAGLGRTGTVLYAFALAKTLSDRLPDNIDIDEVSPELINDMAALLVSMREKRPGLVQTQAQLAMAIGLAIRFNAIIKLDAQKTVESFSQKDSQFTLLSELHNMVLQSSSSPTSSSSSSNSMDEDHNESSYTM